jgi:hypothetical protein
MCAHVTSNMRTTLLGLLCHIRIEDTLLRQKRNGLLIASAHPAEGGFFGAKFVLKSTWLSVEAEARA